MRRHLYTNESLAPSNLQFVDLGPDRKFTTNVGQREFCTSGMGLAHRDDGHKEHFHKVEYVGSWRRSGWEGNVLTSDFFALYELQSHDWWNRAKLSRRPVDPVWQDEKTFASIRRERLDVNR